MGNDDAALQFGERLIALLDGGRFTATYKFAVLIALVDRCLERVDSHGRPPDALSGKSVGQRVFELYWPQARPLGGRSVRQSSQPGDVVSQIERFKETHRVPARSPLARVRARHPQAVAELEQDVVVTVVRMPLSKLQRFGSGASAVEDRFIYEFGWPDEVAAGRVRRSDFDDTLYLKNGVAEWLVRMSGLIRPLVQQRWAGFTAQRNRDHLDEAQLEEFLFGQERRSLSAVREPLVTAQEGTCFYCRETLGTRVEVDHFVPWAKHPDDGLDNLVAAHGRCNSQKSKALAAIQPHLQHWTRRFDSESRDARRLETAARELSWPRRADRTLNAARSLYLWLPPGTPLWHSGSTFVPSDPARAAALLASPPEDLDLAAEDEAGYDGDDRPEDGT